MSFKSFINNRRRSVMRSLTKHVGHSSSLQDIHNISAMEIKRILISRPNSRLGNQLMITPLIQEIVHLFPDSKIDLFIRGNLAFILFQNYENVDRLIKLPRKPFKELFQYVKVWISLRKYEYDIVINVDNNSSSGRLSTEFAKAKFKFFNDWDKDIQDKYEDYGHMAKISVYNLRKNLLESGFMNIDIQEPIPALDIRLSPDEISKGKEVLDSVIPDKSLKTISIYTFATGDKCYSKSWWDEIYRRLQDEFGKEYNIIEILPVENVSQIDFRAPSYYSRDIREMTGFIHNTEIFIGADCGIMHLASAAGIPVVGLFSVSSIRKYEPYSNRSIAIDTNRMGSEDIINAIKGILSIQN